MKYEYKLDVIEKFFDIFSLFYFVFGLFTTYTWGCKELDKSSSIKEIVSFWDPISAVNGGLNILNFIAILFCLKINRKYAKNPVLINKDSKLFFRILCFPLISISIIYLSWKFVRDSGLVDKSIKLTVIMEIGEFLIMVGILPLLDSLSHSKPIENNKINFKISGFVLIFTLIGIINYAIYHLVNQQIALFIRIASNSSTFKSHFKVVESNEYYFENTEKYVQPAVILLYCCYIAYIIHLLSINNCQEIEIPYEVPKDDKTNEIVNTNVDKNLSEECKNELIQPTKKKPTPKKQNLKLPPISFLVSAVFLTIVIIMLVTVIALKSDYSDKHSYNMGQYIITIFPSPFYALSIPLLYLQIYAMSNWPIKKKKNFITDKCLLWLGSGGLLLLSLSEINSNANIKKDYNTGPTFVLHCFLIIHNIFQFVTISLALDREWKSPEILSWHSLFCPTFAMFSVNLAFLFISLYFCQNINPIIISDSMTKNKLFLRLSDIGFYTIGITFTALSRLYSCIIFGKMTVFTTS